MQALLTVILNKHQLLIEQSEKFNTEKYSGRILN